MSSCGTSSRFGKTDDAPKPQKTGEKIEDGKASWYGPNFDGKLTANGEIYDMYDLTAAHRTLPFNSVVKVKNLDNGKSVTVRINDRGPYAKNRIIDLSKKAADEIDMLGSGTAPVELILMEGDLKNSRVTDLKVPTYTVQLASYNHEHQARSHAQKIRGARVEKINMGDKIVYRVYHGIYTDKNNARKKQRQLKRQGFGGYVKQIEN
ncbi:septal ring lytic transglycosylase RlpA family lipoprotein [Aliifodinibius salipaludis]|uniref:Probable endolytic peptidoglycan transglycosylase RlpA n=1 Tax=Fodinibius salipaludis TaxID=2032627 RepID=A0A2A2GCR1_9BACT|nr:septal ring lytic transglycosylase RlpA family lipoprotein [Aliifodinibius salipaludis]